MEKPLSNFANGEQVQISSIESAHKERLYAMGLVPGSTVIISSNNRFSPFYLVTNNTRIAIGRELAEKILCTKE